LIERILVPLDGSEFAEHALPHALAMASRHGAALHLVSVTTPESGGTSPGGVVGEDARERGQASATAYLEQVERRAREAGFTGDLSRTVLPPGNIARSLVRHLVEIMGDLTVMTSHGRGAVERAWLGSTADGFIRSSIEPVLLIRPRGKVEEKARGGGGLDLALTPEPFSRVLVPLDGSKAGERLIPIAQRVAGDDASLLLLRAVAPFTPAGSPYLPHVVREEHDHEKVVEAARGYLEGLAGKLREEGRRAEASVVTAGQPAVAILRTTEEQGINLIAMSTEGRGGVARLLLGSVADKVVRGSPVPVLLYRQPEVDE
jgi:nucleotide-binding universal stress UspA family protein